MKDEAKHTFPAKSLKSIKKWFEKCPVKGQGTLKITNSCREAELREPEMKEQDGDMLVVLFKDRFTDSQLRQLELNKRQIKTMFYVIENGSITNAVFQRLNRPEMSLKLDLMDSTEQIQDLDTVLSSFINIGNQLGGTRILPGQEFLYNAEGLGKKILHHVITTRVLFEGYQFNGFQPVVDFGSIAVLTRAAFESYLTFHYLFIAPKDDDEKEFKLQAWHLGGLDRTKYKPAFEGNIEKWETEVAAVEEFKQKIIATAFFNRLKENRKKDVLNGKWMMDGWYKLATEAGFNERFFRQQYMFLCAYAHSNRQSIIQIQQTKTIDEQRQMAISFIGIITVILAKYAYDYVQLIPALKEKINMDAEEYKMIIQYKKIGELLD